MMVTVTIIEEDRLWNRIKKEKKLEKRKIFGQIHNHLLPLLMQIKTKINHIYIYIYIYI